MLVLIIIIIRSHLNQMDILSKEIKNTFFLEMLKLQNPYDAWNNKSQICVRGKKEKHRIKYNKLGPKIKDSYTLSCWVKINTNKFNNNEMNNDLKYPILAFSESDSNSLMNATNLYPGLFIQPINNTLIVQMKSNNTNTNTEIYNFPYDEWTCISVNVNPSYIEVFINGKLLKTNEIKINVNAENFDMIIGRFPGLLAFLSVNIDPDHNSDDIYNEYLYHRNIIDIYEQSRYKNEYNYDRKQNAHKYKEFKRDFIRKKRNKPNICN